MNTVIDFGIKVWGDKFTGGFDQDGWGQRDRQAKLVNMVMALDKVDLATASRRAKQAIRDLDGNVQQACDVIRAELVKHMPCDNP